MQLVKHLQLENFMKYYIWKSKTPILDSCVVLSIVFLFLFGLGSLISTKLFGVDWDAKSDGTNSVITAACVIMFLMLSCIIGGIFFARFIASKIFGVSVGDSRIELDIDKC